MHGEVFVHAVVFVHGEVFMHTFKYWCMLRCSWL